MSRTASDTSFSPMRHSSSYLAIERVHSLALHLLDLDSLVLVIKLMLES